MMRVFVPLLVSSVIGCCGSVQAQALSAPYDFDCDVPPGNVSTWSGTLAAETLRIWGSIELIEPRHDNRWLSVASVFLNGDDRQVGLQFFVSRDAPSDIQIATIGADGAAGRTVLTSRSWKDEAIAFTLSFSRSAGLTIEALGVSRALDLAGFSPRKLTLSCSSAQFKFTDIVVSP